MTTKFTPRQRAYIRKRTKVHEPDPSEEVGELNIIPFLDITVNIIVIMLVLTSAIAFFSQIEVQLPVLSSGGVGSRSNNEEPPFRLSVTLVEQGIIVSGPANKYAPGCEQAGGGNVITVPMGNGNSGYDWAALTACAERIKRANPSGDEVRIGANNQVQYEDFVGAVDALRGTEETPLFTNVVIVAGVR